MAMKISPLFLIYLYNITPKLSYAGLYMLYKKIRRNNHHLGDDAAQQND